jgi:uncharacterized membrane protein YfcA
MLLFSMNIIIIIIFASLLIGLSKGGLGGPVPVALVTPLLSQFMPTAVAVGIVLPLLMIGDVCALWIYWRKWEIKYVRQMLPMAVVGVVVGGLLLRALAQQDSTLRRILGIFTLIVVIYKVLNGRLTQLKYQPRTWHGYLVGWLSGFGSALANVGAPPFTAYMLFQNLTPELFIGTTTLFFAIINALKIPITASIIHIDQLISVLWAAPLIPLGVWIGRRFVNAVNPKHFEQFMVVLLFGFSLYMLFVTPGK